MATVVPCILCLATTVWSPDDERAPGSVYWPGGMCRALGVQGAGRRRLRRAGKRGLQGEGGTGRHVCVLHREEWATQKDLKDEAEPKDVWLIF